MTHGNTQKYKNVWQVLRTMTEGTTGATRRRLAQELAVVAGFEDPKAPLEQYHTPPDLAAHIVHVADL